MFDRLNSVITRMCSCGLEILAKMYLCLTFGAIFLLYLCSECVCSNKIVENKTLYVPFAPQNLTIKSVSSTEVQLTWAQPTSFVQRKPGDPIEDPNRIPAIINLGNLDKISTQRDSEEDIDFFNHPLTGLLADTQKSGEGSKSESLAASLYDSDWPNHRPEFSDQHDFPLSEKLFVISPEEHTIRGRRDKNSNLNSHRHRKRRQKRDSPIDPQLMKDINKTNNSNETSTTDFNVNRLMDDARKSSINNSGRNTNQNTPGVLYYILFYEEGTSRRQEFREDSQKTLISSNDVRKNCIFLSDRGSLSEYSGKARNVTLRHQEGRLGTKGVKYTLRDLKPYTSYKVWVRAYYVDPIPEGSDSVYASLEPREPTLEELSVPSDPAYVMTDVLAPGPPIIMNLTCQQPPGTLNIQWRRPETYQSSLDFYYLTIRRVSTPKAVIDDDLDGDGNVTDMEPPSRSSYLQKIPLDTKADNIETSISLTVDVANKSVYEVTVAAATRSVVAEGVILTGSQTVPQKVEMYPWCVSSPPGPVGARGGVAGGNIDDVALGIFLLAILAVIAIVAVGYYYRYDLYEGLITIYSNTLMRIAPGHGVLAEGLAGVKVYQKPSTCSPQAVKAFNGDDISPINDTCPRTRLIDALRPPIRLEDFAARVAALHADGDIGFSKEYEAVQMRSAALAHSAHHSHRPENRHKNRYLNITAYDHSRVCLLPTSSNCCSDQNKEVKKSSRESCSPGDCDYVNANFIDGIVAEIDDTLKETIREKHKDRAVRVAERDSKIADSSKRSSTNSDSRTEDQVDTEKPKEPKSKKTSKSSYRQSKISTEISNIESAFLNIEFSGIVEPDDGGDIGANGTNVKTVVSPENVEESDELDDIYVNMDGDRVRVRGEWLLSPRRYIGTQGPTPPTLDAFWRMVWDHRVAVLVMITNLVERGRRKCDMYWPREGCTERYGSMEVCARREDVRATHTHRLFHLRNLKVNGGEVRAVQQYHYTSWPDHGTPDHPLAVLHFVREAGASCPPNSPVVVHCSAGVGRTGTYIVLDAMLNHLRLTNTINVFGFLCHIRTQRNFLVQTEEQYIFIHDALLEAIESGETNVPICKMRDYLKTLLKPFPKEQNDMNGRNSLCEAETMNGISLKNSSSEINELQNGDATSTNGEKSLSRSPQLMNSQEMNGSNRNSLQNSVDYFNSSTKNCISDANSIQNETENGIPMCQWNGFNEARENGGSKRESVTESVDMYNLSTSSRLATNGNSVTSESNVNHSTYDQAMTNFMNMNSQEQEDCKRNNRRENYSVLERMWSLGGRKRLDDGHRPTNLLEKQFKLISRCAPPAGGGAGARAAHNAHKNRPGGAAPAEGARVLLAARPGDIGSEYINASWLAGRRRAREYALTQHPTAPLIVDMARLLWDHTAQIVVALTDTNNDPECPKFWPTKDSPELFAANYRICYLSEERYMAKRKNRSSPCHESLKRKHDKNTPPARDSITERQEKCPNTDGTSDVFKRNTECSSSTRCNSTLVNSFYHRQPSNDKQDEECLIPKSENVSIQDGSLTNDKCTEMDKLNVENKQKEYEFDRSELRIENLIKNEPDFERKGPSEHVYKQTKLSARKSIANGDLFASLTECSRKNGPKSPSKMSLKSFKLGSPVLKSPTKFKFPDFGVKSQKDDVKKEESVYQGDVEAKAFEICHEFLKYEELTESERDDFDQNFDRDDKFIRMTNLTMHSLQDDYQLSVKVIECPGWMNNEEIMERLKYDRSDPGSNIFIRAMQEAGETEEAEKILDEFLRPFGNVFALTEFVGGRQMEYKGSPVVVVDKYGGWRGASFCTLGEATFAVAHSRLPPPPCPAPPCLPPSLDLYARAALGAGRRAGTVEEGGEGGVLGLYAAAAAYGGALRGAGGCGGDGCHCSVDSHTKQCKNVFLSEEKIEPVSSSINILCRKKYVTSYIYNNIT